MNEIHYDHPGHLKAVNGAQRRVVRRDFQLAYNQIVWSPKMQLKSPQVEHETIYKIRVQGVPGYLLRDLENSDKILPRNSRTQMTSSFSAGGLDT